MGTFRHTQSYHAAPSPSYSHAQAMISDNLTPCELFSSWILPGFGILAFCGG